MSVADSRIKVAVRVRPLVNGDINSKIQVDSAKNQVRIADLAKSYSFDYVMDSNASQQAVYNQCGVDNLVDKAIQGYNATLFAYGSTGSGKTYTIEGNNSYNSNPKEQKQGLVARTVHSLFDKLSKLKDNNYTVQCSFLQIYNEKIYDLLNPVSAKQTNPAIHNQQSNISANNTIYNNAQDSNHNDANKVEDTLQKIDENINQPDNEMGENNENTVIQQQEQIESNKKVEEQPLSRVNQTPDTMNNTRCESNNSNNRSNSKSKHEWGYSSKYSKLSSNGKTQNQFLSQTNYNSSSPNHNNFTNSFNSPFMDNSIQGPGLRLRWSAREQFQVENLFVFECKSAAELLSYFQAGQKNRVTASHKINIQSSRSHSMLTIRVEQSGGRIAGRIQLVDLAGSERVGQTGAEGRLAKEGIDINKSLFALRQVINILTDTHHPTAHVPYRESKLTALLKQSIGGSSFCLMIACVNVNDASYEDTLSTLNYASKAAKIHNQPKRDIDYRDEQIKQLQRENEQLQIELDSANQHIKLITLLQSKQKISNNEEDLSDITNRLAEIGEQQSSQSQQPSLQKDGCYAEKEERQQESILSYLNDGNINQNNTFASSSQGTIANYQEPCSNLKENNNFNTNISAEIVPSAVIAVDVDEEHIRTQFSMVAETIRTIGVSQEHQQQFERAACLLQALSTEQESLLRQIQQLKQINKEYANQLQQSQKLLQESQNTIAALQQIQEQSDSQQDRKIVREYEQFSDRLIESIRMVRQLLINNKSLRESTDLAMSKNQIYLQEIGNLEKENQSLRELLLMARRENSSTISDMLINSIDSLSNCIIQDKFNQGKNNSLTKRTTYRSNSRQSGKTGEQRNQASRNTESSREKEYKQARSVSGQFQQDFKNNAFEQSQMQPFQLQQYLNSQPINSKDNPINDKSYGINTLNPMSTLFQQTLDQSNTIKSPPYKNQSMLFTSNRRVAIEEDNQLLLDLDSSSQPGETMKRFKNRCAMSSLNKSNASDSLTTQEIDTSFYDRKLQSSGNIQISSSTRHSFASEKKTPTKQRRQSKSNQRDNLNSANSNSDQQDQNTANMDNLKLCQDSQPTHFCKNILSSKKTKINNNNNGFGNEQENQQQQQYSQHPSILPPVFQLSNNVTPTKQPLKKKQVLAQNNQTDDLVCSPNMNHLQNRSAKLVACYGPQQGGFKRISNKSQKSNNPLV